MAIEDNLDQLYALYIANNILCMRMWAYVAAIGAKAEGFTEQTWIDRHRKMSLESADLWKLEGHRNPERLRQMVKDQLNSSWNGMIMGARSRSQIQYPSAQELRGKNGAYNAGKSNRTSDASVLLIRKAVMAARPHVAAGR